MKILFCTNVFRVVENGPVKFANLILRINQLYPGHEIHILTEDIAASEGVLHRVRLPHYLRKSYLSQFFRMWIYHQEAMKTRKKFPFDTLVYNNAIVGLWSALRFKDTVVMINDDNNLPASRTKLGLRFGSLKQFVFHWVERTVAKRARLVIANSNYLKEAVVDAYGLSPFKVHRLYKAVEIISVPFPKVSDLIEPIRVLFVKSDYQRGGLLVLIDALQKLPYQFQLTIVGPQGPAIHSIRSYSESAHNVRTVFLGKISQFQIVQVLSGTDIFCVPSYREALGVANLEAMAAGVPVVATAVGGVPEVMDQGACGWLVPPADNSALARALYECITQPAERLKRIDKARRHVQKFNEATMFDSFLSILHSE